jgi:tetratricopeptide (TPR) repeat protein
MDKRTKQLSRALDLHKQGQIPEAIRQYEIILKKTGGGAALHLYLGIAYAQSGKLESARKNLERCIFYDPKNFTAHFNYGKLLEDNNLLEEAKTQYEQSLQINPKHLPAYLNLSGTRRKLGDIAGAIQALDDAISVNPKFADAHTNRGILLAELNEATGSIESLDQAIHLNPMSATALNNRGARLRELNRLPEALEDLNRALELQPAYAEAHNNRGNVLRDLNKHEEALLCFDKALSIQPNYASAHWNKSITLLALGKFQTGWSEYEWRLKLKPESTRNYAAENWVGSSSLGGKTLFVYSEQGYGDIVQFCRYLPEVASRKCEIIFELPQNLLSLVSSLSCKFTALAKGASLPKFDAYCALMSLPHALGTDLNSIPGKNPYLSVEPDKISEWKKFLGPQKKTRIGLAWSGRKTHQNDHNRSISLELLHPILQLPYEFHSLQTEYRSDDLKTLNQTTALTRHDDVIEDFADTAALIECLDLVIAVDTSIVHVAGALGKPVWILLPYSPDFRWMLKRIDSPWYPTAKLFRQKTRNDWSSVIEDVVNQLRETSFKNGITQSKESSRLRNPHLEAKN